MGKRLAFLIGLLVFLVGVFSTRAVMRWLVPPAAALVNGQVAGSVVIEGQVYVIITEDDARRLVELLEKAREQNAALVRRLEKGGCV